MFPALLLLVGLASAGRITLEVSNETVPSGATTQIKISLARPLAVARGTLFLDLDRTVFGEIWSVAVFSAAGDAFGEAFTNCASTCIGEQQPLKIDFESPSGTVGVVRNLPIAAVAVATLPAATAGVTVTVTGTLYDCDGKSYEVEAAPGSVTIGGGLSIAQVYPDGNVIRVVGTGFDRSTEVEMDSVALFPANVVGPTRIDLALAAPAEITGKRIRVRNPDGSKVDFFPVLPARLGGVHFFPILPLQTLQAGETRRRTSERQSATLDLLNPNPSPAEVTIQSIDSSVGGLRHFTIHPYGFVTVDGLSVNQLRVLASAPIRMLQRWSSYISMTIPNRIGALKPVVLPPLGLWVRPGFLSWSWRPGSPMPAPQSIDISPTEVGDAVAFTVIAETHSGGKWLSAAPSSAWACSPCFPNTKLTVSVDPSSLAPGIHRGTITIRPVATAVRTKVIDELIDVTVTVGAASLAGPLLPDTYLYVNRYKSALSQPYTLSADLYPGPFTVGVRTDVAFNWLSATSPGGTTPAVLNVSANPANLGPGTYSGRVILGRSGMTHILPVVLDVFADLGPRPDRRTLAFGAEQGSSAPITQTVGVRPQSSWTASSRTESGGDWLRAARQSDSLLVTANPARLAPGAYSGVVALASPSAGPVQLPVTLVIWSGSAPALSISPHSLYLTPRPDAGADWMTAGLTVASYPIGVPFNARAVTSDGRDWLKASVPYGNVTWSSVSVQADAAGFAPGLYTGSVIVSGPGQSVTVPVIVDIPDESVAPLLGSVVNAASSAAGAVAPGEMVTIRGVDFGKAPRVLFDGVPARSLAVAQSQIHAVVPEEVGGRPLTIVEVESSRRSPPWGIPVTPFAPGVFGVLNQDGSQNGADRPAMRGTVVQIYATGAPAEAVGVLIGGAPAGVVYAGSSDGLLQVNAVVPPETEAGPAVPVVLTAGPARSQDGVSLAVE